MMERWILEGSQIGALGREMQKEGQMGARNKRTHIKRAPARSRMESPDQVLQREKGGGGSLNTETHRNMGAIAKLGASQIQGHGETGRWNGASVMGRNRKRQ